MRLILLVWLKEGDTPLSGWPAIFRVERNAIGCLFSTSSEYRSYGQVFLAVEVFVLWRAPTALWFLKPVEQTSFRLIESLEINKSLLRSIKQIRLSVNQYIR